MHFKRLMKQIRIALMIMAISSCYLVFTQEIYAQESKIGIISKPIPHEVRIVQIDSDTYLLITHERIVRYERNAQEASRAGLDYEFFKIKTVVYETNRDLQNKVFLQMLISNSSTARVASFKTSTEAQITRIVQDIESKDKSSTLVNPEGMMGPRSESTEIRVRDLQRYESRNDRLAAAMGGMAGATMATTYNLVSDSFSKYSVHNLTEGVMRLMAESVVSPTVSVGVGVAITMFGLGVLNRSPGKGLDQSPRRKR